MGRDKEGYLVRGRDSEGMIELLSEHRILRSLKRRLQFGASSVYRGQAVYQCINKWGGGGEMEK